MCRKMVDLQELEIGDVVQCTKEKGGRRDYEVVDIREEKTFSGSEEVFVVSSGATDEIVYEKDHEHWEMVEGQ